MNDTTHLMCELCEIPMSCETPPGKAVRYFHCARCGRWVASNYGDALVRAHTAREDRPEPASQAYDLEDLKARLGRWLTSLDESDPYFVLGVPPSAPEEAVRTRFKELALAAHPDRGGDPAAMRRYILAYDRIRSGKRVADVRGARAPVAAPVQVARVANQRRRG